MKPDELRAHFQLLEIGAEKILKNNFATLDKGLEISNSINIEFTFNSQERSSFDLFAVDFVGKSPVSDIVILAQTRTIGNTQNNKIDFSIKQEITYKEFGDEITVLNTTDRQTKSLAEEILHSASLGHVGITAFGDRPDEKDADIMEFTPKFDPKTNVMIERGTSGQNSTTNVYQFQKVEAQVRKDLGKKVEDKKIDVTPDIKPQHKKK